MIDRLPGERESIIRLLNETANWMVQTYDDIHSLVQVHYDAVLVYDGDRGDRAFREHVDNIEDGCIETGRSNGVIGVWSLFEFAWE